MPALPSWAEESSANPYAPKPKNAMKPRSSSPAQPTTMFSPTASSAITSASIPTCSWNPPRPSSGSTAAARPATASRGHQPIRSACCCARPSQDGRYSRRCASLATHSSAPTCGPAGGGGESRLTASYLLQLRPAEQPAGPRQHHDDQQREYEQVAIRRGDVPGDHRLRD